MISLKKEEKIELFSLFKRLFDGILGCALLLSFLPLFFLISLLIKCTSKGPVFYSSMRLGKGGKLIRCWKFRTMQVDAEKKLHDLLKHDARLRCEWMLYSKLKKDPRITPVGRWLRKTSLDEFPQFWNVVKGDLSLVGPRPYLIEEVENKMGKRAEKILSIRPGLTGLWQISGRNLLTLEERMRLEESYVDQRSFFLDLRLICKTIPRLFFPKGAF
jgi:exopolysaccharide production protein ExoY